ncbi:uncharacterized protein LOC141703148 [Apium graveolens]|uniref:uncharacterized protein LOC141703148 n=1 Tax=Apium graveolens TaxID=4045 RepID=UPI003D794AF6
MNPTWPLASFLQKVVNDWNFHVSIFAIGRAKKKALEKINGNHIDQYGKLWEYGNELLKVMPDSTIKLMTEEHEVSDGRKRFKRFYICLGPLKRGFRAGCRPLLDLDAWAIVEAENSDSWNWFLMNVKEDLNIENDVRWAFISDKQKGLIDALEAVFPNVEHRFCVMYLYRNMWKDHKGIGVRMLLWLAARATTDYTFNKHMEELKKLRNQEANGVGVLSEQYKSDIFVNTHCEVFNSSITKYRDLPIISMLKAIHKDVMRRIQQRRDKMQNSYALNPIYPNAMRRLNKAIDQSKGCHVLWSGGARYLVTMTGGGYEMVVDLEAHKCACKKWELSGIPCYHACACIAWSKKGYEPFIHQCFTKDLFLECYKYIVEPICGEEKWTETPYPKPLPPEVKPQTGRPKKKRSKKNDVVGVDATRLKRQNTTVKCTYCTEYGHNTRTCPAKTSDITNGCEKTVKIMKKYIPKKKAPEAPTTGQTDIPPVQNPIPHEVKNVTQTDISVHEVQGRRTSPRKIVRVRQKHTPKKKAPETI